MDPSLVCALFLFAIYTLVGRGRVEVAGLEGSNCLANKSKITKVRAGVGEPCEILRNQEPYTPEKVLQLRGCVQSPLQTAPSPPPSPTGLLSVALSFQKTPSRFRVGELLHRFPPTTALRFSGENRRRGRFGLGSGAGAGSGGSVSPRGAPSAGRDLAARALRSWTPRAGRAGRSSGRLPRLPQELFLEAQRPPTSSGASGAGAGAGGVPRRPGSWYGPRRRARALSMCAAARRPRRRRGQRRAASG